MTIPTAVAAWLVALSAPLLIVRAPPAIVRSSAARAASAESAIVAQPLRSGAKVTLSSSSGMKLTVAVMAGGRKTKEFSMPGCTQLCCVARVRSADEAGCTAGELVFGPAEEVEVDSLGEAPRSRKPEFAQQTYSVTRGAAGSPAFTIEHERGSLSTRERDVATHVADATLGVSPLGAFLAGRAFRDGESVDVPAELAQRVMKLVTSDTKVRELRLTFAGAGKEAGVAVARFGASAKLATDANEGSDDLSATIDLAGELLVARATGLVLSIQLTGPVHASASVKEAGQELELVGTGTWTIDYTARVE